MAHITEMTSLIPSVGSLVSGLIQSLTLGNSKEE